MAKSDGKKREDLDRYFRIRGRFMHCRYQYARAEHGVRCFKRRRIFGECRSPGTVGRNRRLPQNRVFLSKLDGKRGVNPLRGTQRRADGLCRPANCALRSQVLPVSNYSEFLLLTTSRTGVCSTWMPVERENFYAG